jgi:peroxiredoxin
MKNTIQILSLFVFCIIFNDLSAQSRELLGKAWELKKELQLTDKASEHLKKFNAEKLELLKEIKGLESDYFAKYAEGNQDIDLKDKIRNLYNKKDALVNAVKKRAIVNEDEAFFLELMQHIRPKDLREFLKQSTLTDSHRSFYAYWLENLKYTEEGTQLKNFVLSDQQGKSVDTKEINGKTLWVESWASKCGPCIKKLKQMKPLYSKLKDKGFVVLAVSWDYSKTGVIKSLADAKKDWTKVINKHDFNWLNVFDHGDKIMEGQFGSTGKNLLVSSNGIILGYDLSVFEVEEFLLGE